MGKVDRAYVKNRLAYELYNTDMSIFKASVKACVAESIDNKYDNFPNESVFTFQPWDQHVHPKALKVCALVVPFALPAPDCVYLFTKAEVLNVRTF